MWLLMTSVMGDLTAGSLVRRSCYMGLAALSLFSLGLLGGLLIQTMQAKWMTSNPSQESSGNAYAHSTIPSYGSNLIWSKTDATSMTKRSASARWSTGATGGN